jgi:hypothetical protein
MTDSRRSWMIAGARAAEFCMVSPPSLGQVFRNGFLNGSMLQMAVCSPPREAATTRAEQPYAAIYVTRMGARAAIKLDQPIES